MNRIGDWKFHAGHLLAAVMGIVAYLAAKQIIDPATAAMLGVVLPELVHGLGIAQDSPAALAEKKAASESTTGEGKTS